MNTKKSYTIGVPPKNITSTTSQTTDNNLAEKVKQGCSDSLNELINRHSLLFYKIFHQFEYLFKKQNLDIEELIKEKDYIIYKAIIKYNPRKKMKVSSWIGAYTRYFCLSTLNKNNGPLSLPLEENWAQTQIFEPSSYVTEYVFDILSSLKDKRIEKIFKMRYFGHKTSWNDIGKKINLSSQATINLYKKGIILLRNKMNNKNSLDIT